MKNFKNTLFPFYLRRNIIYNLSLEEMTENRAQVKN